MRAIKNITCRISSSTFYHSAIIFETIMLLITSIIIIPLANHILSKVSYTPIDYALQSRKQSSYDKIIKYVSLSISSLPVIFLKLVFAAIIVTSFNNDYIANNNFIDFIIKSITSFRKPRSLI